MDSPSNAVSDGLGLIAVVLFMPISAAIVEVDVKVVINGPDVRLIKREIVIRSLSKSQGHCLPTLIRQLRRWSRLIAHPNSATPSAGHFFRYSGIY